MKNKAIAALLILGLFFSGSAFAIQENKQDIKMTENKSDMQYTNDIFSNLSLDDCIRIAIKNNLSIQSSELTDAMYKEKIGKAWANYFPEIGAGVDWARNKGNALGTYTTSYLPQVSASMLIFDFGKTKANADSAKNTYKSKQFETQEHINTIVCNIKRAYYNLLFAKAQYFVYTDTVKDFELQKERATRLYQAGKKAKVDVAIADYNLCKAKLNFEKAKNTLKVAKYELSRLMGFPEYNNYELSSKLGKDLYTIDLEKAMNNAYEVRPELLAVQKASEAAKMDLRAKRRNYTPDIKINAAYGNNTGNYREHSYSFGANLNYSNFNILKTQKTINEARIAYEKSKVDLEDVKQTLYLNVNRAYENFVTAQNSIAIAENAMAQAKEQYRQTTGRYNAGIADIIELKDGENAYLNARLDYYNSLLNYNISIAEFEKEIGAPLDNYANKVN